jgi:hypothetical protein
VTHEVPVRSGSGPAASFDYSPANPTAGETVTFTSTSTPSQGSIASTEWDFDGDGVFDATGEKVSWIFDEAGPHIVAMRVTQANGKRAVAFESIEVAERPTGPPPDPSPQPQTESQPSGGTPGDPGGTGTPVSPRSGRRAPVLMRPFPIVRIAGVVLPRGARITILSVRAPRGAKVRVRCRGRGCPVGSVARSSATSLVRFHRFEQRLRAGVRLKVFVRKAGRIGKYTRFLIRAGKPPSRVDRCLMPGRARPVRCP